MRTSPFKRTIRITGQITVLLTVFFLYLNSCQKEKYSQDSGPIYKSTIDCNTACIAIGGPYFEKSDQVTVNYGNQSKIIDIVYYNTETDFVLKVKSTKSWSDLVIDGISSWTNGTVAANTWGVYSTPLPIDWEACDNISFDLKVTGNGPPGNFGVNYNLIGLCPTGCESAFTGEAISCDNTREAVYTFRADEDQEYIKIQGGLTNFTGADATVEVSDPNLSVTQWTPGGSTNRVIKLEGPVDACEEITIRIKWNSSNGGEIITGSWSVKDANGLELAPAIDGLECQ